MCSRLKITTWKDTTRGPEETQWVADVVRRDPDPDGEDVVLHVAAWFPGERAARSAARRWLDGYFCAELHGDRLLIEDGAESKWYAVTALESAWGRAYRLNAADGYALAAGAESYDCLLDGARSSCECQGFLRFGRCRHLRALEVVTRPAVAADVA